MALVVFCHPEDVQLARTKFRGATIILKKSAPVGTFFKVRTSIGGEQMIPLAQEEYEHHLKEAVAEEIINRINYTKNELEKGSEGRKALEAIRVSLAVDLGLDELI